MASWSFRRGVVLFHLKRQMDSVLKRNLSTSTKLMGDHAIPDHYPWNHGGPMVKHPMHKVNIGNREVRSYLKTESFQSLKKSDFVAFKS